MSDRPEATMNRNIAAVRPLRLCANRNDGSNTACLLGCDQPKLLCDEHRLRAQLLAPARNEGLLEAHLRHRDADRRDRGAAVAIAHRNADAAQVRHELLDVDREATL